MTYRYAIGKDDRQDARVVELDRRDTAPIYPGRTRITLLTWISVNPVLDLRQPCRRHLPNFRAQLDDLHTHLGDDLTRLRFDQFALAPPLPPLIGENLPERCP